MADIFSDRGNNVLGCANILESWMKRSVSASVAGAGSTCPRVHDARVAHWSVTTKNALVVA
jgi:hypothetical protein